MKHFYFLRFVAVLSEILGMIALLSVPFVYLYYRGRSLGGYSTTELLLIFLAILPFLVGGIVGVAIGQLIGLLISLEENARYTADYLRQRSKPKQE